MATTNKDQADLHDRAIKLANYLREHKLCRQWSNEELLSESYIALAECERRYLVIKQIRHNYLREFNLRPRQ